MPKQIILPEPPSAPSLLCADTAEKKLYWDRSNYDSPESQMRALAKSSSLYIGNLSFDTRTSHLKALFSTIGPVKKVHLGLDRFQKTPCGFALLEYASRSDALDAVVFLSGTKLDGKVIRVELDAGFKPGRQYGRGSSGGQVRDDRRGSIDPKRRSSAGRSSNGGSGGAMASRWEAPPTSQQQSITPRQNSRNGGDPVDGHYGPSAVSGSKRGRGDSDEDMQGRSAKNSRFDDEE